MTTEQSSAARELARWHIRGSSLLLVGRTVALVLAVATQVVMVRALSKEDYGTFAYGYALVVAATTVLSLGQGKMLSRFMAKYEEEADYPRMFGTMALTAVTIAATSVVLIVVVLLAGHKLLGGAVQTHTGQTVILVLVLLAPLAALDQVFVALFAVLSEPRAIFFRKYILTPGLRLVVVAIGAALGVGVVWLSVGYVVSQLAGLVVYSWLLVGALRERGLTEHFSLRRIQLPVRAVLTFSLPTVTRELVLISMSTGSVIILNAARGVAAVAGYRAVFPAARLNQFFYAGLETLFLPMISRLHARRDFDGMRDAYWNTALFLAVFTFPVFALTAPFASVTTTTLFGARYAGSAPVLLLLSLGYYVNIALGFNTYTVQVFGKLRRLMVIDGVFAGVNIGLSLLLVRPWGAVGIALANCLTLISQNVAYQVALARATRSPAIDRRCVRPYAVLCGAGAVLFVVDKLMRPGIVVAVGLSAVATVAVLVLTRRSLLLGETFPELGRVPVVGGFLVATAERQDVEQPSATNPQRTRPEPIPVALADEPSG